MTLTRRQLVAGAAGGAAAHALLPAVARVGDAFGKAPAHPAAAKRNRLVVIHLVGGNDGLNTVIPTSGSAYDVYRKVRPSLAYQPAQTLPINSRQGFNRKLKTLHRLYRANRVAVVQGVDYPDHSYSHFTSSDIWHSGEPGQAGGSGWLGRHLDRVKVREGELRAVGIGYELPLILRGERRSGVTIESITATRFGDGMVGIADARHDALALFAHHDKYEPLRRHVGQGAKQAVDLVDVLSRAPYVPSTKSLLGDAMLMARTMLGLDLGTECVFIGIGGYDTHTSQRAPHERLLGELDVALEAFFYGTARGQSLGIGSLPEQLATRTTVLVMSEFGRRIGENGAGAGAGTDHGAAAPVFLIGPRGRIRQGLHGEHPPLGTTKAPQDNLRMTVDVRQVYQTILDDWLNDPDPLYRKVRQISLFR